MSSFSPKAEKIQTSSSRGPNRMRDGFAPKDDVRCWTVPRCVPSQAEKTFRLSAADTRILEDDGDQRNAETGPWRSDGRSMTAVVWSVSVERTQT